MTWILSRLPISPRRVHYLQAHHSVYKYHFYLRYKTHFAYRKSSENDLAIYSIATIITFFGLAYAFVPFYKLLCQQVGLNGVLKTPGYLKIENLLPLLPFKTNKTHNVSNDAIPIATTETAKLKPIKVTFMTTTGPLLPWKFVPTQKSIYVRPGETALAFFTATNLSPTNDITGISTYSVAPHAAASFLTKIQCFCFEQQRLAAGESVDMPVYFYLDPNIREGHYSLKNMDELTLSYSFFSVDKLDSINGSVAA